MPSKAALDFAMKLDAMPADEADPQKQREKVATLLDFHIRGLVSLAGDTRILDRAALKVLETWKPQPPSGI
jgi:hypothetical protein